MNLLCQEVKIHPVGAAGSVTLSHGSGGLQPEGAEPNWLEIPCFALALGAVSDDGKDDAY